MNTSTVLRALRRPCSCSRLQYPLSSTLNPLNQFRPQKWTRSIHSTPATYAPDRPTSLTNMLASEIPPPVQVASVGPTGIKLADGLVFEGAVVFLEGKVFLWDVPSVGSGKTGGVGASGWDEWKKEHWEIFEVVVPKPEILIFGTGARMELVPSSIRAHMKELGIQMDVMDTKNACSTYNLLAEEGRRVAAALLPIEPKNWTKKEGW